LEQQYLIRFDENPKAGDVVIFGPNAVNKYGHVAIIVASTNKYLVVFEQDGIKQDGAKIDTWSYARVLGYLTKR
jgi:hypothetical protein